MPLFFLQATATDPFALPYHNANLIRLVCCILLHMHIYPEVRTALTMLRYLKYVKTAKGGKRGRVINILLCLMQFTSPIVAECVLILAIAKTPQLQMIIKSYVALGFVTNIDNMFSEAFPDEIKSTAGDVVLKFGKDQNTLKKIWHRVQRSRRKGEDIAYFNIFINLMVNLIFFLATEFYVIIYYYFFPLLGIIVQVSMFFLQETSLK